MMKRESGRLVQTLATLLLLMPCAVRAQGGGWHSLVEASASSLFGATSQTLASIATAVSHGGEDFSADATFKFYYGESKDADRAAFVSSRSWALGVTADALPKARWSPFVLGNLESSFEKRLERRVAGGAGAKWVMTRTDSRSASISLALLGEHVTPMRDTVTVASSSLLRWSWRVKTEQHVADRFGFSHVTFYAPVVNQPGRFTISSQSVGSFDLSKAVALTLTFIDNYDSEAVGRGAPTNNDGSLLFGIRGKF